MARQTAKAAWTAGVVRDVRRYFADGVNMDTEDAIAPGNRTSRDGLTDMAWGTFLFSNTYEQPTAYGFDLTQRPKESDPSNLMSFMAWKIQIFASIDDGKSWIKIGTTPSASSRTSFFEMNGSSAGS